MDKNGSVLTAETTKALSDIFCNSSNVGSPFLLLRYPNKSIMLASNNSSSSCTFSFAPFDQGNTTVLSHFEMINIQNIQDYTRLAQIDLNSGEGSVDVQTIDKQRFISNVVLAKNEIEKGILKKVVLSKAKKIKQSVNAISTFIALEERYETALIYCFYHPKCGAWIGATPEKLLEKEDEEQYQIHSLAGTKLLNEDWSSKEIEEQKIVTDYITTRLKKNGVKDIDVKGPTDYEYGLIKHLKSSIHFQTHSAVNNIVAAIHPTPAVCGMPLNLSKKFILKHEGYDRSYYTGYIGLKNMTGVPDSFFVNLRCMQLIGDNTYIYTGAGIVADSDPENEWEEVEAKAKTLIDCIAIDG